MAGKVSFPLFQASFPLEFSQPTKLQTRIAAYIGWKNDHENRQRYSQDS